ncbi:MAG: lysophospholipase [Nostoc sp. ZfuVER08]|uniref:Lysophospholipase n=1 Tax=Nostoc punctiforme FACHB-252 TaxID=1357509 RepID=A0ABR8HGU6_NOSPU|nr:alpha/beta hydrolase [Nostoc punctiforme]MBD2614481.1 lysophospholipase [Nostoc punctiforme FACHB-252]MBL1202744.1 alpha/beta hydrolase [Nostoc sp. GBBB01]MDZ8011819.1 lysophospholipase [Nostoc sp. ZfuVER08]
MNESSFEGVGGLNIFTRSWHPERNSRGVLVIVHGFNSHSGQYFWVAEQFVNQGLAVYALDHRGRGRSDGDRFYVEKVEDYVDDVATFVTLAKSENPGLPVFVLGHSAGGVISCVYALDHQAEISGLICESFAYELPVPDLVLSFLKGLSHITPHTHVFKLNNKDFSRDPQVVESMNNDPLIKDESQPTQTAAAMIRADERLRKEFPLLTLPLLILHGTEDKATKPTGSQHFYEQAGSTDKTLRLYEGHYHDLLNDIDKEVVIADILKWIDERIPAKN